MDKQAKSWKLVLPDIVMSMKSVHKSFFCFSWSQHTAKTVNSAPVCGLFEEIFTEFLDSSVVFQKLMREKTILMVDYLYKMSFCDEFT